MSFFRLLIAICTLLYTAYGYTAEAMKFAYYDQYAPRSYMEDGKVKGILIDIIEEAVHKRMGIDVIHEGFPWVRAQAMVEQGSSDAFITIPTPARASYTNISKESVIKFETFIGTASDNPHLDELKKAKSINDLKDYVFVDYIGNGFAENLLKGMTVYWLPDYSTIFRFIAQKKADVIIMSRKGIYTLNQSEFSDQLIVLPTPITSVEFHLCIGKKSKYTNILSDFDKTIKQMKNEGVIDKMIQKYY